MRDPDVLFTILESDFPASNGIIHIIDKPFTLTHIESSKNNMEVKSQPTISQPTDLVISDEWYTAPTATLSNIDVFSCNLKLSSKTIGEIFREDERFNRFLSLVDVSDLISCLFSAFLHWIQAFKIFCLFLLQNCGALLPIRGSGPLTVLVPTNKAIDKFRDGSLMYMLSDVSQYVFSFLCIQIIWIPFLLYFYCINQIHRIFIYLFIAYTDFSSLCYKGQTKASDSSETPYVLPGFCESLFDLWNHVLNGFP